MNKTISSSLMALLLIQCLFSYAQTGPGGVGSSTTNFFFLRADAGTSTTADGSAVSFWNDQSGNANHVSQATGINQPVYKTTQLNGLPTVRFDGTNDFLNRANGFPTNSDFTKFVVGKITATVSNNFFSGTTGHALYLNNTLAPKLFQAGVFVTSSINMVTNQFALLSGTFNSSSLQGAIFVDGASGGTGTASVANITDNRIQIGAYNSGNFLAGDVAEVIGYKFLLNTTQRIIVENYLSAKYGLTLTANDLYMQDNSGNGDYDFDVAGIGRVNATDVHTDARGTGFVRILNPSNMDDGEFLIWGRDSGVAQATNTSDIPSGVTARFARVWRVSETGGDVGNVDLQIDVSGLADFNGLSPCDAAGAIRLLVDTNNNGTFADQTPVAGAANIGGTILRFAGVSALGNDTRFTLAIVSTSDGPGGVGNASNNFLFLKADAGISTTTDGSAVSSWSDQSGNSNLASQATGTRQPLFKALQINGLPALRFDGVDDFMTTPGSFPTNSDYTKFVVGKVSGTTVSNNFFSGVSGHALYLNSGSLAPKLYHGANFVTSSINMVANQFAMLTATFINSSRLGELFVNSSSGGTGTASASNADAAIQIGAAAGGNILNGDVAEVVGYNFKLNSAQRIIVENYLSAKYNIALTANDVYTGDNSVNGDFDFDVAGIGRANPANIHANAKGAGIVRISNATDLGNGEYFLWGHDNGSLTTTNTSDLPSGIQVRMNRVWSVSEQGGEVGSIDLQFDLTNQGTVTETDLRLLIDHDGDGIFNEAGTVILSGASALSCNNYLFSGVSAINDGMRFTVGSMNIVQTPLPITLISFNGDMKNGKAYLNWVTGTERNNDYFVLERTKDSEKFENIASIRGAGNSLTKNSYQAVDNYPPFGKVYYRLRQVDFDGQFTYSNLIALQNNSTALQSIVSPNPVSKGNTIEVQIMHPDEEHVDAFQFTLYNLQGSAIPLAAEKTGKNKWTLTVPEEASSGLYILRYALSSDQKVRTERLIIR